jgi:hypothetical protein
MIFSISYFLFFVHRPKPPKSVRIPNFSLFPENRFLRGENGYLRTTQAPFFILKKSKYSPQTTIRLSMYPPNFRLHQCPSPTTKNYQYPLQDQQKDKNHPKKVSIRQKYPYKFEKEKQRKTINK